jgi:succinate dehydrogenase hydrophobic anchor subunit
MNEEDVFSIKTNRIMHAVTAVALLVLSLFLLYPSGAYAEIKPGTISITPSLGG